MKINKLIYPLEARVMLDGAAAIDVIDNVDDILQIKKNQTIDSVKFIAVSYTHLTLPTNVAV